VHLLWNNSVDEQDPLYLRTVPSSWHITPPYLHDPELKFSLHADIFGVQLHVPKPDIHDLRNNLNSANTRLDFTVIILKIVLPLERPPYHEHPTGS
jgi:hypothetical protein